MKCIKSALCRHTTAGEEDSRRKRAASCVNSSSSIGHAGHGALCVCGDNCFRFQRESERGLKKGKVKLLAAGKDRRLFGMLLSLELPA